MIASIKGTYREFLIAALMVKLYSRSKLNGITRVLSSPPMKLVYNETDVSKTAIWYFHLVEKTLISMELQNFLKLALSTDRNVIYIIEICLN